MALYDAMRVLFLFFALLLALPVRADVPVVAAAASLRHAMEEAAAAFTRATGTRVRLTYGASGSLVQQLRAGAPYQLFLSADEAHVLALAAAGLTRDRGRVYAIGRLVLVAPTGSALKVDPKLHGLRRGLADGSVRKLAVANPAVAPYGMRAREALQHAGLWRAAEPRLVFGENVGQALQFATAGGADGGFVSLSLVLAPEFKGRGRYALVSDAWHAPLTQRMVLMQGAGPVATRFHDWLLGSAGQAVLRRHGYLPAPAGR